ncbi:armadillo-type protein [Infundibulicybe gibba]|nr:armadillo-type protein [Infundibulicybe gibba]
MFKAILPSSKRIVSSDFTMITPLGDVAPNGKENLPGSQQPAAAKGTKPAFSTTKGQANDKRKRGEMKMKEQIPEEPVPMNQAFDQLLDDLQIPTTLRPKLAGMDSTVKAAMLKSSQTMVLNPGPQLNPSPPDTPKAPGLRKTRSIESMSSPIRFSTQYDQPEPSYTSGIAGDLSSIGASPYKLNQHARGASFDAPRLFSHSQVNLSAGMSTTDLTKAGKEKGLAVSKNISPTRFFSILSGTSSTQLDVENIKKLRLLLRNESASWSQEFLRLGGYSALLTRLNEILEVEWREEQHDDQILHELLRCFKALSTSSIGCFALRSSCPTPFVQLVALLYSDKKPGEVATRQLIVDLLLILFELYPSSSLPAMVAGNSSSGRSRPRREAWETESTAPASSNLITLPAPHKTFYSLIRALLLTPAPPPSESPAAPVSPHAFIESLHRPRIYKTYLQELSDVCRDYFWVFCHPNNTIWVLSETDEGKVEKPRAPGGMTGGVEFEAMGYFTTHLKLLNAIASNVADLNLPKDHDHSAYRFHSDLFLSGLERIILISRKASTTFYPTLHLELARYIAHVGRAGYELPWTVSRLIGMPPPALAKNPSSALNTSAPKFSAPSLPPQQPIEPLRFN